MTDDLDSQISELECRKQKLIRLARLREEVGKLEKEAIGGHEVLQIIVEEVCAQFNLSIERLHSSTRPDAIATPRMVVFYLTREMCSLSTGDIGKAFKKDHSTVIYGAQRIKDRMETEKPFAAIVEGLKTKCESRIKNGIAK